MTLKNELRYAVRTLARDNALCERAIARLTQNERAPRAELQQIQNRLLLRALHAAARQIPFYVPRRRELNGVADAAKLLTERFPVITKEDLLARRQSFYPASGKARYWTIVGRTSGTTGTPLDIVRSPASVVWANAFKKRHWRWSGYRPGMRYATLRGDFVVAPERQQPPFWFYNRYDNQLIVSSRHLRSTFLPRIIDQLLEYSPYLLEAYPSTAYELALYLRNQGAYLEIPCVYTGSEPLYPHQRELIRERLRTRIFDHYGMAERVAYATECERGNLHVNSDYSFVEIVDEQGNPTDDYGYVVGTSFHNLAMPLIRYRLSDRTKWKQGECACGRAYPMIEPVTGKLEDVIYGSDGSPISASVVTFAFKELENIRQSQVAQVGAASWEIRVVPAEGFGEAQRRQLIDNVKRLVDPKLAVNIVLVNDIPRTPMGKYKWVVNEYGHRPESVTAEEQEVSQ